MNSHVIKFYSQFNNTVDTGNDFIVSLSIASVTEALQYREACIYWEPSIPGSSTYRISDS
jgi:hypothetical protein